MRARASEPSNSGWQNPPPPAGRAPPSQVRRLGVVMACGDFWDTPSRHEWFAKYPTVGAHSATLKPSTLKPIFFDEDDVLFSVSSSQMGGMDIMVGSSTVHLPTHSSVHHPLVQMVLFAAMFVGRGSFYYPRSMVPKSILDISERKQTDACGNAVPTAYKALWVPGNIHSAKSRNGNAISYACGTVRRSWLSLPVLFDVSMKCKPLVSRMPESKKCPGDCCKGYTCPVSGADSSTTLQLFAPSNAGAVSDFIQLNCRPDGSVHSEEHQYILKNPENEQNDLLCVFEQPISCSKYLKTQEGLICDTESACLSVGGGMPGNPFKICALAAPQSTAPDDSSSSTGTVVPSMWIQPHLCLDSGATNHMAGDPGILSNLQDAPAGLTVTTADGSQHTIAQIGIIQAPGFEIRDVYFVPGLQTNLISVRQLSRSGICTSFDDKGQAMLYVGQKLVGVAVAKANMGDLYWLRFLKMP